MPFGQLGDVKKDISGLIELWGSDGCVLRRSVSANASGRASGTFKVVGVSTIAYGSALVSTLFASGTYPSGSFQTGKLWVQPSAGSVVRGIPGVVEETSHVAFVRKTVTLLAQDRVRLANESYEYDVLDTQENPSHNVVILRRVKRS